MLQQATVNNSLSEQKRMGLNTQGTLLSLHKEADVHSIYHNIQHLGGI